ncbi:MAG: hypothetical protein DRR08_07755 [Candidatus Parabeggiatoa sp. nov. 2]|nr:MAG: hypothetical protein DRR08_07755 [Gammaproteobacteria bacterium]
MAIQLSDFRRFLFIYILPLWIVAGKLKIKNDKAAPTGRINIAPTGQRPWQPQRGTAPSGPNGATPLTAPTGRN